MKRRSFLKVVGGATGCVALGVPSAITQRVAAASAAELPRRVLGRTGAKVSVVGFPGLALVHYDQARCNAGVRRAFDNGVNYFDVAPAYGEGDAETKLGPALQGLERSRFFLACKTKMRDKDKAREELERSLKRLKTDYFDLYQLHHLRLPEEVKRALGPGGAMETILKAKEEGKVKHIGFSAHTTKAALAALEGFAFDTVMFPISFAEYFLFGFGQKVVEAADRRGAAVLAIKPMCRGAWPEGVTKTHQWWYRPTVDKEEVSLAWRFTLSQKGVVAGIPPSFLDLLDLAIEAGRNYQPITEAETDKLKTIAAACKSIFQREEESVACGPPRRGPLYPDSPHEGCRGIYA
jgi:predicted aldo/keto reductase-like oxidoreductase